MSLKGSKVAAQQAADLLDQLESVLPSLPDDAPHDRQDQAVRR